MSNESLSQSVAALEKLIEVALGASGQSRVVAGFLLAWWNAEECGGFDLTHLWSVDTEIAVDMLRVFSYVAQHAVYPDMLGYGKQFETIFRLWRNAAGADPRA